MTDFGSQLQPIQFPLLGNSIAIGLFSLLHIALAGLTVGFMVLAPGFEALGWKRPHYTQCAHSLTRFTVIVFSASAVFAVIMVELMIGLFPVTTMWLWNQFRYPLYVGITAFLLQLAMLYPYYHYWERIRRHSRAVHLSLGILAALFMLVWVSVLDGMGSYMLTPTSRSGHWSKLANPTWVGLVLHRFVGNLVIAGYAMAAYAGWRLGRATPDTAYYRHLFRLGLVVGVVSLLLQPLTGLLYVLLIEHAVPDAYAQLVQGSYQYLVYAQFLLVGLLFVGSHFLVKRALDRRSSRWLDGAMIGVAALMVASVGYPDMRRAFLYVLMALMLWHFYTLGTAGPPPAADWPPAERPSITRLALGLGLVSVLLYLTMGTIREIARRPDAVRGMITLQEKARHPAPTVPSGADNDAAPASFLERRR